MNMKSQPVDEPVQEVLCDKESGETKMNSTKSKIIELHMLAKKDFKKVLNAIGTAG